MRSLALALLFAVPLFAQRFDEAVTVNVVDVPVYVERFGVPIEGLTRDDFTLFVDGKPQPIDYFDGKSSTAGSSRTSPASRTGSRRWRA